ncbi:alpha-amylase family glycosyl hydrolase [Nitrosococcus wardiae]|uniref:DUF3459 domain-containing protein n=1 Tax=Nitrosococcus wardiae TaxID=1814290 RepID=A0A4P7BXS9_9GAMM|nr:alpha-amylase family glycosyl hydrolase [Nitrosococcus wardiae]QBQ53930.1 DUF3459 domain-containing protein [Nitrosococcus wardiae]
MTKNLHWWQYGVIYQLIVRSFFDTNGDGEGDLPGVINKLDYIQSLGIEAIWLSPIYPSPMAEFGYDVTDYTDIHPLFGTLNDFDALVTQAHDRGIKIILDWIPNHTSDQHPWFMESRSSRDNPKRDWYIWRDPKPDGAPPSNWISVFGGSVWEWSNETDQYYCHTFLKEQPDLNWRNPEVQQAMLDVLRFWLERGVDGFRIDATCLLIKDDQFRDNPPNPDYQPDQAPDKAVLPKYTRDQPTVHDVFAMIRRVVDDYDDRMLAGELYLPIEKVVSYYGKQAPELHLPLNLQLAWSPWNADKLASTIDHYENQLPAEGWPTWTISTHDSTRIASRAQGEQARVAAMLHMTLRGTPTLYYGAEIGMQDVPIAPEQEEDPQGKRTDRSRDPFRTPMQWDNREHAGFTSGQPWLPVAEDFSTVNVAVQHNDPHSLLNLYRRLINLRRCEPTLISGAYISVPRKDPFIAYQRQGGERRLLVVLNLSAEPQNFNIGEGGRHGRILLSTFMNREKEEVHGVVELRGNEGVIIVV